MIKLIMRGPYTIVWTKDRQRMLYLGEQGYLWSHAKGIGELLSFSKHPHKHQYILAEGIFKVYKVNNEENYVDLEHLELSFAPHKWQGYLLLTGLPTRKKIRSKIVPTSEVITDVPKYIQHDTATTQTATRNHNPGPSPL